MDEFIVLNDETAARSALCDAQLTSIAWREVGQDLYFDLIVGVRRAATLRCSCVSGLRINLRYDSDAAGYASSWECRFERHGTRWHMTLDFASRGQIQFACDRAGIAYHRP
jgi:hypothetical protein